MNYAERIQHQAERVFDNKEKADAWLRRPKMAFGGRSPIAFADSEAGYLSVKDTLAKIDQGYVG